MARNTATAGWWSDFDWVDGRIRVRKTGVELPPDRVLFHEVLHWLGYFALLAPAAAAARLAKRRPVRILFQPETPRPWYMTRGAMLWSGLGVTTDPGKADAAFFFDDSTRCEAATPAVRPAYNFGCLDISKSRVAEVFEEVFGYPLRIDPVGARGALVEKPETNGVHGGAIVEGPCLPRPGFTYQKLIDTQDDDGCCTDLRTICADGAPVVVVVKTKPPDTRFAIQNDRATLADPDVVFSEPERDRIGDFLARIGLDFGGLDILRDREDGRIYIVDVNKTDVGPVIALSWRDKVRCMRRLGRALEASIRRRRAAERGDEARHAA